MKLKDFFDNFKLNTELTSSFSQREFEQWSDNPTAVYENEAAARDAEPKAFQKVEERWGRAGEDYSKFYFACGTVVEKRRTWWDVPSPPNFAKAYFISKTE